MLLFRTVCFRVIPVWPALPFYKYEEIIPPVKKREKKYKPESKAIKIQVNKTICLISDFGS